MSLIIGLLTIIMVLNSLFLILLILVQLPKKEAGAGLAFGAGAAEAVFGAGAGTPLSKITKYSAGLFLGLALLLSIMNSYESKRNARLLEQEIANQPAVPAAVEEGATTAPITMTPTADATAPESEATAIEEATTEGAPAIAPSAGAQTAPLELEQPVPATEPNPNN
jgi:preprotein translocase subunit SecG